MFDLNEYLLGTNEEIAISKFQLGIQMTIPFLS